MKALLPAAGYATRLYPLTWNTPKALLPIGGKPLLEHVITSVQALPAIDETIVISNATFYPQFREWYECSALSTRRNIIILNDGVSEEKSRRGTVGDIAFALKQCNVEGDIAVVNVDNFFSFALQPAYDSFVRQGNTIALRRRGDIWGAGALGAVALDEKGMVRDFREKCRTPALPFCSLGVYFFKQGIRQRFVEYLGSGNVPDRFGDFISWLHIRENVYGFVFEGPGFWYDIGTPDSYGAARRMGKLLQEQGAAAACSFAVP